MIDNEYKKVLLKLQLQCSKKEYCSSDIYSKAVKSLNGDHDKAQSILDSLTKDGFVDDLRYSNCYARTKLNCQSWGKVKIKYMLLSKKIQPDIIDRVLNDLDADCIKEKLVKCLSNKCLSLSKATKGKNQFEIKRSLINYGLSKGFQYEQIIATIDEILT